MTTRGLKFIFSDEPREDKIEQIAEYKESIMTTCNIGPELEVYSVVGLNLANDCFSYLLADYVKSIDFIDKFKLTQDLSIELAGRNATLGYCFRLAEEIVNAYLPEKLTTPYRGVGASLAWL